MLNRRQVRIRAMQSLYAYAKSKGANLLLAKDHINDSFQPDLNSMEPQDRQKLEGMRKLATEMFEEKLLEKESEEEFDYPKEIREVTSEAERLYQQQNQSDFHNIRSKIVKEAEKVYDLYISILDLFIELAQHENKEAQRTISGLHKNKILAKLTENQSFENQKLRRPTAWEEENFVRKVYKEILLPNERYKAYAEKVNHTAEEELAILKYLTKNVMLKNSDITKQWENFNIYFTEDRETLRSMVAHTFQAYLTTGDIRLRDQDEDWEDKKDFMLTLMKQSEIEEVMLLKHILPKLKNWEFERVAETDKILLKMALVEMIHFPSIPIKVTINEIIEIAKSYSTPRSSQFINGILDVLSKELTKSQIIKKSGRGMLDNK